MSKSKELYEDAMQAKFESIGDFDEPIPKEDEIPEDDLESPSEDEKNGNF